ncbi:MAG: hypothetical protein ACYDDS_16830 [Candidatus Sulfotelmatobacter sp.]|jgi:hypothetical protein
MQFTPTRKRELLGLTLVLLTGLAVFAKDGRDFAGYYSFTGVTQQSNEVKLTITVQVFNYSDADIEQASVVLHQSDPGLTVQGAFPPVKVFHNQSDVRLSQEFSVPREEYQRWQNGMVPRLMVHFMGANGIEQHRSIQLSRRPMLPTH